MFILREAKVQIVDRIFIYLGIYSICFISLVPFAAGPPFVFDNKYTNHHLHLARPWRAAPKELLW